MKKSLSPRFCFLAEVFHPVVCGATIQMDILIEQFSRRDGKTLVVTRKITADQPGVEQKSGVEIIRVNPAMGYHRLGKYLMMLPALFELLRQRRKYDVIIVFGFRTIGIIGVLAAKLCGKKCYLRAESCGEMDGRTGVGFGDRKSPLVRTMIRSFIWTRNMILLRCNGFLSISSAITNELKGEGIPEHKIREITNGIDLRKFLPVASGRKASLRQKMGMTEKSYFVYSGRLAKGKGLEYLLRVWACLIKENKNIHLLLVGSGQGYAMAIDDKLKNYVLVNGLDKSVTFTGIVHNVSDYLQAADFFVLPSQSEGMPLTLLEAMACGLPCIATDVGGIKDLVKDGMNGLLVPYGDTNALFQAMSAFLNDPDCASRLGQAGHKKIQERDDLEALADRYVTLL
jgi:glycosyltransferase involved in cell wall biosynthesis